MPNHILRRRCQDKPALKARLVFSDQLKGDLGILSEDLFAELFPAISQGRENYLVPDSHEYLYVAIASCESSALAEKATWTVVPIRLLCSSALPSYTIQFSSDSTSRLINFAEELNKAVPSKWPSQRRPGLQIWILDVIPLTLETIFLALEKDAAQRNGDVERTIRRADNNISKATQNGRVNSTEQLIAATREALSILKIVHTGDVISIPPRPHSNSRVSARVTFCEPVGQGVLSPHTNIIITQKKNNIRNKRRKDHLPIRPVSINITEEDEDASNDQFYSATEDRDRTDPGTEEYDSATGTETDPSTLDTDDVTDDSTDDMISLAFPMLSTQNPSGVSTMQPGTPHNIGTGMRHDMLGTPVSVYSTFTATSTCRGGSQGTLFKTQALISHLSEEIIYPKPISDDDEEARIFVDINSLTKIGCFSGDWVQLRVASEPPTQGLGLWGLGSHEISQHDDLSWRAAKVFGLPERYSPRPITRKPPKRDEGGRKMSFLEPNVRKTIYPTVYLSPILLANMAETLYCKISPLKQSTTLGINALPKLTSTSRPPFARDLSLVRISTPLSTEISLQNVLFAGLQRYFASRTRIVKQGDFVAIGIDENLGHTLYQPGLNEDSEIDDILTNVGKPTGVAWFRINHVGSTREIDDPKEEDNIWGDVVSVDATSTRISQSGSENCRLPGNLQNPWEYYLGIKKFPHNENHRNSIPKLRSLPESKLQRRLRELIAAATDLRTIHLQPKPLAILIVSTQRGLGKATIAQRAFANLGLHSFEINAYDIVSGEAPGSDVKTAGLFEARAERALACGSEFCGLLIRHIEILSTDRMISSLRKILEASRVLVATTSELEKIPDRVRSLFTHELEMTAPNEWERENILKSVIDNQPVPLAPNVDLSSVAVKTAALVAGDLVDVVERALVARKIRLENIASRSSGARAHVTVRDVLVAGGDVGKCLVKADFDSAVDAARKNFADAIGAPKIPNVTWSDVGGLKHVKDAVMESIELPLERPELFANGMKKRSGILFYGPPGTGKTLLAKAIATEFSLNFFSVKGPELLNMYIGESEANVRRVFQRARDARPCVVFFDELDSVAPKRGNQGDSGGVMDRIVSQLLAELDGMSNGDDGDGGVFVIGATNRPDLLDAALLRPGRFDKMLYLGVSETHEKQLTILEALTRKFPLHPNLSLHRLASRLPFTYTGADFYALCSDAMLKAAIRQSALIDARISEINASNARQGKEKISTAYFFDHFASKEDIAVMVIEDDFWAAERELIPSVSVKELENYKRIRDRFEKVEDNDEAIVRRDIKGKGKAVGTTSGESQGYTASTNNRDKWKGGEVDRKGKRKVQVRQDERSDSEDDCG